MRILKRVFFTLLTALVVLAGVLVGIGNSHPVSVAFAEMSTPELPLAFWLGTSFLAGILVGMLVLSPRLIRTTIARSRLEKQAASVGAPIHEPTSGPLLSEQRPQAS